MLAGKYRGSFLPGVGLGHIEHTQIHAVQRLLHAAEQRRVDPLDRQTGDFRLDRGTHRSRITALAAHQHRRPLREQRVIRIEIAADQTLFV